MAQPTQGRKTTTSGFATAKDSDSEVDVVDEEEMQVFSWGYLQANPDFETFSFTSLEQSRYDSLSLFFLIHSFPPASSPSQEAPSTAPHFAFQSLLTKKYLCAGSRTAVVSRNTCGEGNFKFENGDLTAKMKGGKYQWLFFDTKRKGVWCFGQPSRRTSRPLTSANVKQQFIFEEVTMNELRQMVMLDPSPSPVFSAEYEQGKPIRKVKDFDPPMISWKRRLDQTFAEHEEFDVRPMDAVKLASLGYRMHKYIQREKRAGRIPIMNPFYKSPAGPRMGVPIGGIGAGTVGRGWRGDFGRWGIFPGFPCYRKVEADCFGVFVGPREDEDVAEWDRVLSGGDGADATILSPTKPESRVLGEAWDYKITGEKSTYYALYPRSWTVYNEPDPEIRLTCEQISPVIANNYKESSFPVGVFEWHIENLSAAAPRTVSLLFSFENNPGEIIPNTEGGAHNRLFVAGGQPSIVGIAMHCKPKKYVKAKTIWRPTAEEEEGGGGGGEEEEDIDWEAEMQKEFDPEADNQEDDVIRGQLHDPDPLTLGIAVQPDSDTDCEIFWCQKYITNNVKSASQMWHNFRNDGSVMDHEDSGPAKAGETIGACLACKVRVQPRGNRRIRFALAWDSPLIRFSCGRAFYRRYTKWYGKQGTAIESLLKDSLLNCDAWKQQIVSWQKPVLDDLLLPTWYKHALFNELYYIAEGGSIWTDGEVDDKEQMEKQKRKEEKEEKEDDGLGEGWEREEQEPTQEEYDPHHFVTVSAGSVLQNSVNNLKNSDLYKEIQRTKREEETKKKKIKSTLTSFFGDEEEKKGKEKEEEAKKGKGKEEDILVTCHICKEQVEMKSLVDDTHHCSSATITSKKDKENPELQSINSNEHDYDPNIGRFGYMESLEYLMVNTYDVHFYASWALAMNWPKLELALQRDFGIYTLVNYKHHWRTLHSGKGALRKVGGAVPHDLGTSGEDPWYLVNSYNIQPINDWKDLNSKFVLQVYRAYVISGSKQFLWDTWDAIRVAIERVARFDTDNDGVLENEGFPDQTYDTWSALGCSAYSGGLWLAALSAAAAISRVLGLPIWAQKYEDIYFKGKRSYATKLWNKKGYFNYDSSTNTQHDSIMADQMCGQWYARACGMPPIAEPEQITSSLRTVFDKNVMAFRGGRLGAVNGMRPTGYVDTVCLQSVEVWTGTTYGLSSTFIGEGMVEEGFRTAWGIVNTTYETKGYQFQTPEAWNSTAQYRALAYMRPLAIWGMQWAWERKGKNQWVTEKGLNLEDF